MKAVTATVLLWHYYEPSRFPMAPCETLRFAYNDLTNLGLLEVNHLVPEDASFEAKLTDRGETLVKYWLTTPLPVMGGWVIPEREEER